MDDDDLLAEMNALGEQGEDDYITDALQVPSSRPLPDFTAPSAVDSTDPARLEEQLGL